MRVVCLRHFCLGNGNRFVRSSFHRSVMAASFKFQTHIAILFSLSHMRRGRTGILSAKQKHRVICCTSEAHCAIRVCVIIFIRSEFSSSKRLYIKDCVLSLQNKCSQDSLFEFSSVLAIKFVFDCTQVMKLQSGLKNSQAHTP